MGKLNIQRNFDKDVAESVRRATEAENMKRNERTIVRLDEPPVFPSNKRSKASGTGSLAKKAISNRIASSPAVPSQAPQGAPRPATPVGQASSARSVPGSSKASAGSSRSASTSTSKPPAVDDHIINVDLDSPRSRALHRLALEPMTLQQFRSMLCEVTKRNVDENTSQNLLNDIGEIVPAPKTSTGPPKYQLKNATWKEVRPKECPGFSSDERIALARKGRLTLGRLNYDSAHPLWACFQTDTTDKGETSKKGGGVFLGNQKATTSKPGKAVATGAPKAKAAAKPKAVREPKEEDDFVEPKADRKVSSSLDPKGKVKAEPTPTPPSLSQSTKRDDPKASASSSINKPRPSSGTVKKEPSPLPPRSSQSSEPTRKRKAPVKEEDTSEIEEGELPTKAEIKKRKTTDSSPLNRQREAVNGRPGDVRARDERERPKPKIKEDEPPARIPKDRPSASSSRVNSSSKDPRSNKEIRDSDFENPRDRGREVEARPRTTKRRRTPSFSSTDSEDDAPTKKKSASSARNVPSSANGSTSRSAQSNNSVLVKASTSSKPAVNGSKAASSNSSRGSSTTFTLAEDKSSLKRQYNAMYGRYMELMAKMHSQRSKVESILAGDSDAMSTDGDADMMDDDELNKLVGEHDRIKAFLEKIKTAHIKAAY